MAKVPFTVSARAAILIGRENIANAKGAIIELVKNCYDADSPFCIIYIDNEFCFPPEKIYKNQYDKLIKKGISIRYFNKLYEKKSKELVLKDYFSDMIFRSFTKRLQALCSLYIVDVGEGMTQEIIEKHWMTIGTDNKLHDFLTSSKKRIKSGAKGIGRFALDKLGGKCQMITIPDTNRHKDKTGIVWTVNWSDFEGENKVIGDVNANIEIIEGDLIESAKKVWENFDLINIIKQLANDNSLSSVNLEPSQVKSIFKKGTILKISNLHDIWNDRLANQIFNDLEVLAPPRDIEEFSIYMLTTLNPDKYGEVLGSVCDDFDYKITAKADQNQNLTITIEREEYDISIIPQDFFEREAIKKSFFANKQSFLTKKYTQQFTFSQLFSNAVDPQILKQIGSFDFTFYFLKKITSSDDSKRFFYKSFRSDIRKNWLERLGGIKIYRDNFRVRPYGEVDSPAFDWLGLGSRRGSSPAGVARAEGGYRVELESIAGTIKISRLTNLSFEDKSSREGLQETETFQVFKNLIIAIIAKFEEDRSFIARELKKYDDEKYGVKRDLEKAKIIAKNILERERKKNENKSNEIENENIEESSDSEVAVAFLAQTLTDENAQLKNEQKLLRALASSGIISASFGHDLGKIKDQLSSRVTDLLYQLNEIIDENTLKSIEDYDNPFITITEMQKADKKILTWLGFSLGFIKKDKRKRRSLYLESYFDHLKLTWNSVLHERGISLNIECEGDISLRAYEIDFDSIFINLFTNSMDAFSLPSNRKTPRRINIKVEEVGNHIQIDYRDNGPGLSDTIKNPEIIFDALYTTNVDHDGKEVGSGLGMWIVKTVVDEYKGSVKILSDKLDVEETGFGIRVSIPIKYKIIQGGNNDV